MCFNFKNSETNLSTCSLNQGGQFYSLKHHLLFCALPRGGPVCLSRVLLHGLVLFHCLNRKSFSKRERQSLFQRLFSVLPDLLPSRLAKGRVRKQHFKSLCRALLFKDRPEVLADDDNPGDELCLALGAPCVKGELFQVWCDAVDCVE